MSERTLHAEAPAGEFHLVKLGPQWAEQIASLESVLFGGEAWNKQILVAELSRPDREYVGALAGPGSGVLLGYGGARYAGDQADVMTVATIPAARRRGIASAIVAWIDEASRRRSASSIFLEVRSKNLVAQRIYKRAGYEALGRIKRYYRLPPDDAVRMGKKL
ncbi:GNAT family N-acetyltransferase [Winkia sp. UMB10116]|uniref:GNAT family N-acetyltransferase n=1 Tax=Winkia TaxID=2692118 RepID=UPI00255707F7|nr:MULTISPECIES: GNAT family N-acetyltransferase [Winkia]MDK6240029.1 GNAT family N-acetyltransferase [Winkia sp. UMB10116]MDU5160938.1 GNAT family N-acetyltransferase [Winkia neuii]